MQIFHIRFRNTQGTLLRILNAISRRALDMPYVQSEPTESLHHATLVVNATPKQVDQLCREWHAIVDVVEVRSGAMIKEISGSQSWVANHAIASAKAVAHEARSAMA